MTTYDIKDFAILGLELGDNKEEIQAQKEKNREHHQKLYDNAFNEEKIFNKLKILVKSAPTPNGSNPTTFESKVSLIKNSSNKGVIKQVGDQKFEVNQVLLGEIIAEKNLRPYFYDKDTFSPIQVSTNIGVNLFMTELELEYIRQQHLLFIKENPDALGLMIEAFTTPIEPWGESGHNTYVGRLVNVSPSLPSVTNGTIALNSSILAQRGERYQHGANYSRAGRKVKGRRQPLSSIMPAPVMPQDETVVSPM